ncbi:MAG: S9 family peptidase, partial [Prevotellaceae bacterium]|nr:S9 family peptidase [Prevotellaceae bacterium]
MNTKKLLFTVSLLLTLMTAKAQITGDWKGTLNVQGMNLELIFHITDAEQNYSATLDIPLQGAAGIPIETIKFEDNLLTISSAQLQLSYKGTLSGETIEGTFEQAGMSLPLNLTKFESKLPGDVSLPSTEAELAELIAYDKGDFKYKVEDYFARP